MYADSSATPNSSLLAFSSPFSHYFPTEGAANHGITVLLATRDHDIRPYIITQHRVYIGATFGRIGSSLLSHGLLYIYGPIRVILFLT